MLGLGEASVYSAFLSHASQDRAIAEEVTAYLEEKGYRCWVAPRDVRPGEEYAAEIIRGIERAKCFVLLLFEALSFFCACSPRGRAHRIQGQADIYPVRIEDVPPSPKLE